MSHSYHSIEQYIAQLLGAEFICGSEKIQAVWSGYGRVLRCQVRGFKQDNKDIKSIIVKHITIPEETKPEDIKHPRGWNTSVSHQRKIRSYHVEACWYRVWSAQCDESCRVPKAYYLDARDDELIFVLEDLDASGFSRRILKPTLNQVYMCLRWLASLHAKFMRRREGQAYFKGDSELSGFNGLWPVGSYWQLATRFDELHVLEDSPLKSMAKTLDLELNSARYYTLIHGDAKLANFCFSEEAEAVSAVDFQYAGGGCGMKDVVLLLSSCFGSEACYYYEEARLARYFCELKLALTRHSLDLDFDALEREWRWLYCVAWADFVRFLKGWSPGHWKLHRYSESMTEQVMQRLAG